MTHPLIALIDIGKTHAKVSVIDPQSGAEVRGSRRANAVVQSSAMRELDVEAISQWLLGALRDAPHRDRIRTLVPVAHGAAAVLIDHDHGVVAAPDYEDACFERVNAEYRHQRDAYRSTYSPDLPLGLNLGRQLFFLQEAQPRLFSRVAHALLYPQFWAWRLSGVMASEVTSLGCHSDLWLPREQTFSKLAEARGWSKLFPARKHASDVLGPISAQIAAVTGLNPQCQVTCGIHDSNASYLKFLIAREDEPFTVISSGTWTVVMANRADLSRLREDRDMLASVDAFGSPVATARFMGGREYEAIAGTEARPNLPALLNVIERQSMALPAFASGGPFAGREGRLVNNVENLSGSERASMATLYVALMCELLIEMLGAAGTVLIDGPLATNPLFGSILGALLPSRSVELSCGDGGNTRAACHLAGFHDAPSQVLMPASAIALTSLPAYRETWRKQVLG